tara:strand:+ start:13 stop:300 length:288 start_codon:yes stop_codon:yes gene_type:complete
MITSMCYFGTNICNNENVTKKEWDIFVNQNIVSELESFTISDNTGYYKGKLEITYILTIIHDNSQEIYNKLNKIKNKYIELYNQEEVMITNIETT